MTKQKEDLAIAEKAEAEVEAQLAIIRALKPLSRECRQQVMEAAARLIEADALVGGVIAAFLAGGTASKPLAAGQQRASR